ncbi:MAG: hypothetical protein KY457_09480, partial [Actinobacteria bacterium]|nr:hypothetical protein [Actinomycetota bacterium]
MSSRSRRFTAVTALGVVAGLGLALAPAPTTSVPAVETFAPQLVTVDTPTRAAKDRLTSLGLDLTEHAG